MSDDLAKKVKELEASVKALEGNYESLKSAHNLLSHRYHALAGLAGAVIHKNNNRHGGAIQDVSPEEAFEFLLMYVTQVGDREGEEIKRQIRLFLTSLNAMPAP